MRTETEKAHDALVAHCRPMAVIEAARLTDSQLHQHAVQLAALRRAEAKARAKRFEAVAA